METESQETKFKELIAAFIAEVDQMNLQGYHLLKTERDNGSLLIRSEGEYLEISNIGGTTNINAGKIKEGKPEQYFGYPKKLRYNDLTGWDDYNQSVVSVNLGRPYTKEDLTDTQTLVGRQLHSFVVERHKKGA